MPNYINKAAWQDALLKEEILAEIGEGGGGAPAEVTADDITDASTIGKTILTAANVAAIISAIGAATAQELSDLADRVEALETNQG